MREKTMEGKGGRRGGRRPWREGRGLQAVETSAFSVPARRLREHA